MDYGFKDDIVEYVKEGVCPMVCLQTGRYYYYTLALDH